MNPDITGVILAGGQATRMQGNDKGLIELHGRPLIEYVIECIKPQTRTILVSANRSLESYAQYGYRVIEDTLSGYRGPLAGILSGMQHSDTEYIITVPCDTPYLPEDLAERLWDTMCKENRNICVASDGAQLQPVIALISCELTNSLEQYLNSGQARAEKWVMEQNASIADFSDCPESFFNINSANDISIIENHENYRS